MLPFILGKDPQSCFDGSFHRDAHG
jgi:hypothetical protein